MHVHSNLTNLNALNPYSDAAEKAVAAQRAADVRKKLMKNTAETEGAASPEEVRMISQWTAAQVGPVEGQMTSQDQYHPATTGKDPDFG